MTETAQDTPEINAEPEAAPEVEPEEKASEPEAEVEGKASDLSTKPRKLALYDGKGRIHTEEQIDQILDWYLETGELPMYVSERQRYSYRHHVRLPERRKLLEQQKRRTKKSQFAGPATNILSMERARGKRKGGSA